VFAIENQQNQLKTLVNMADYIFDKNPN